MEEPFSTSLAKGSFINHLRAIPASQLLKFSVKSEIIHPKTNVLEACTKLKPHPNKVLIIQAFPESVFDKSSLMAAFSLLYSETKQYPTLPSSDQFNTDETSETLLELMNVSSFCFTVPVVDMNATIFSITYSLSQPRIKTVLIKDKSNHYHAIDSLSIVSLILSERSVLSAALSLTLDEAELVKPIFISLNQTAEVGTIIKAIFTGNGKPCVLVDNEENFLGSIFEYNIINLAGLYNGDYVTLLSKLRTPFNEIKRKEIAFKGAFSLSEMKLSTESSLKTLLKIMAKKTQESICVFEATEEMAGIVSIKNILKFVVNFPFCDLDFRGNDYYKWKSRGYIWELLNKPFINNKTEIPVLELNSENENKKKEAIFVLQTALLDSGKGAIELIYAIKSKCKEDEDSTLIVNDHLMEKTENNFKYEIKRGLISDIVMAFTTSLSKLKVESINIEDEIISKITPLQSSRIITDTSFTIKDAVKILYNTNSKMNDSTALQKGERVVVLSPFNTPYAITPLNIIDEIYNFNGRVNITPEIALEKLQMEDNEQEVIETDDSLETLLNLFIESNIVEVNIYRTKKTISLNFILRLILSLYAYKSSKGTNYNNKYDYKGIGILNIDKTKALSKDFNKLKNLNIVDLSKPISNLITLTNNYISFSYILSNFINLNENSGDNKDFKKLIGDDINECLKNLDFNDSSLYIDTFSQYINKIYWVYNKKLMTGFTGLNIIKFLYNEYKTYDVVEKKIQSIRKKNKLTEYNIRRKSSATLNSINKVINNKDIDEIEIKRESSGTLDLSKFDTHILDSIYNFLLYTNKIKGYFAEQKNLEIKKELFLKLCTDAVFKGVNFPNKPIRYMIIASKKGDRIIWENCLISNILEEMSFETSKALEQIKIGEICHFATDRNFLSVKPNNSFYRLFRKAGVVNNPKGLPVISYNKKLICVVGVGGILALVPKLGAICNKPLEDSIDKIMIYEKEPGDNRSVISSGSESEINSSGNDSYVQNVCKEEHKLKVEEIMETLKDKEDKLAQLAMELAQENYVVASHDWSVLKTLKNSVKSQTDLVFLMNHKRKLFGRINMKKLVEYVFGLKFCS
eukprot:GAHX01001313.1.p1 GENE.GAHX01001313.1~~GAHX01001313.1.p1  ORF type:complete len:1087 (-),score=267.36 GAHX01001313.1:36-3296(-)